MFAEVIAQIARDGDTDVQAAVTLGHVQMPDEEHLRYAAAQGRCVVTRNYDDFSELTARFMREGEPHAGVVFVPRSIENNQYAAIAAAIINFARLYPDGLPQYAIMWLSHAKGGP